MSEPFPTAAVFVFVAIGIEMVLVFGTALWYTFYLDREFKKRNADD